VALPPFVAFEICVGWSTFTRIAIVKRAVAWMLRNEMYDLVQDVMEMRTFKSKRLSYRKGSQDLARCMLRHGSYEFLNWFDRNCPTSDPDKGYPWPDNAFSLVGTAEAAWFLAHTRGGMHAPKIAWGNWEAFRRDFTGSPKLLHQMLLPNPQLFPPLEVFNTHCKRPMGWTITREECLRQRWRIQRVKQLV